MILRLVVRADLLPKGKSALRTSGTHISAPFGRWTIATKPPRPSALCRITKREGMWLIASHALPRVALA